MKLGEYKAALDAFKIIRQKYPRSGLSANAAYWLGEIYLIFDQPKEALTSFLDVINNYPKSSKIPSSMLRAADTYKFLGSVDDATRYYQKLVKKFPADNTAKRAKKRLKEIEK